MDTARDEAARASAALKERLLRLEGGRNFRDIGGYETMDGKRIRWRRVYRSGSMHGLTEADYVVLAEHAFRRVFDLRSALERAAEPSAWCIAAGLACWTGSDLVSFADLQRVMERESPDTAEVGQAMIAGFRDLPFVFAGAYAELFNFIAAGETPIIINCSAGKDRTGVAVAVLLAALGVPRETIVADFVLTDHATDLRRAFGSGAKFNPFKDVNDSALAAILRADPAYISAALESIDDRCGSIGAFVRDVMGLEVDIQEKLRNELLE